MVGNAVVVNFAGGETDPKARGRFDQPWYLSSAKKILNWIVEALGPARFRPGFQVVRQTRGGAEPRLFTFQVSVDLVYTLEFTPGYLRAYKNGDLITAARTTITAITKANPAVITVASTTGLANGDEIILTGLAGMEQLENRQVKLAGSSGSTFQLVDPVTGSNINSTNFNTYSSGGTVNRVAEITTPYNADDLPALQYAQSNTIGYFVCPTVVPYKLTVDSADTFTLATFVRTNDPFTAGTALNINYIYRTGHTEGGITVSDGTLILFAAGSTVVEGVSYTFAAVGGTVEINGGVYRLDVIDVGGLFDPLIACKLLNADGSQVDSSAWTQYTTGGTATPAAENPIAVAFYEGRLGYFGTTRRPDCFFLSRSPDSSGNSRYDDFTGGSNADHACFFQLAPVGGTADYISWAKGGPDYLFLGTFGGPYRVSGSGLDIPITPTSINVRQFDTAGCEETMAAGLSEIFYVQRGGGALRSIKVINPYLATFESRDLTFNAQQVAYSPLQRVVLQHGRPDVVWTYREDGKLCGMSVRLTVQQVEELTGWHQHKLGGDGEVVDLVSVPRNTGFDQLWIATMRVDPAGTTRHYVEVMADDVSFPDPEDFFGSSGVVPSASSDPAQNNGALADRKADDLERWMNAMWRAQEDYVHLDSAALYDGSTRGAIAGATLTPSSVGVPQVEGESPTTITLTASAAVFLATDVGSEIWVKPGAVTGRGAGRALITAYISSTQVTATVSVPFLDAHAVPAGDWYFAVSTFYGFHNLEGEAVAAVADGAVISDGGQTDDADYPTITVSEGSFTLPTSDLGITQRAAVLRAGLPYTGILETHNLEMGGRSGPAQSKARSLSEVNIRFLNSLGVEYGTDLYNLKKIEHRLSNAIADRPPVPFSGIRRLQFEDGWSGLDDATREKNVVIVQRLPVPAIVQFLDLTYDIADEGGP